MTTTLHVPCSSTFARPSTQNRAENVALLLIAIQAICYQWQFRLGLRLYFRWRGPIERHRSVVATTTVAQERRQWWQLQNIAIVGNMQTERGPKDNCVHNNIYKHRRMVPDICLTLYTVYAYICFQVCVPVLKWVFDGAYLQWHVLSQWWKLYIAVSGTRISTGQPLFCILYIIMMISVLYLSRRERKTPRRVSQGSYFGILGQFVFEHFFIYPVLCNERSIHVAEYRRNAVL